MWFAIAICATSAALAEPVKLLATGRYQLRLAETLDPTAQVFRAEKLPLVLVISEGLSGPWLIAGGERTATPLDPATLSRSEDGQELTIDPAQKAGTALAAAVEAGGILRFQVAGKRVALEPADPLLGEVARESILAMPEWRRNAALYHPTLGDLRLLETAAVPTEVEVFFGSWCPHCEKYVPRLLTVSQQLKTLNIRFKFHGVPHKFDDDPEARLNKVVALPTALIRQGGKVVARIEELSWEHPEGSLTAALFGGETQDASDGS